MATGIGAVKQAFVKGLRDITALTTAVGSNGIYEGVVHGRNVSYPFVVYQVTYSTRSYDFGRTTTTRMGFDVFVISDDQVQAHNLDQLIIDGLHDKVLDLSGSGQTSLLCRRSTDLSLADLDEQGSKVYQVGGSYAVWTQQTFS